uniref:SCP domain-containing protein n=1 Tax=Strongyloides stercoralis TaxID=6248 RepID=A0A0K0DZK6_STRER
YKQFTLKLNLINLIAYNNAVHTYRDNLYAYLPPHKLAYRKCKNEAKMIQAARIIESSVYKTQFEVIIEF